MENEDKEVKNPTYEEWMEQLQVKERPNKYANCLFE